MRRSAAICMIEFKLAPWTAVPRHRLPKYTCFHAWSRSCLDAIASDDSWPQDADIGPRA